MNILYSFWDSLMSQSFEFMLDEEPLTIEIDPDNWILKKSMEIPWVDGIYQPIEIRARSLYSLYILPLNSY